MQGIYTYVPETNNVPREYIVAAILLLVFMVPISLVPALALLYFHVSTLRSMCAVLLYEYIYIYFLLYIIIFLLLVVFAVMHGTPCPCFTPVHFRPLLLLMGISCLLYAHFSRNATRE
jgi:hypothetical protein